MQSPPFPRYLLPPRFKYFPQHPVLKHPQLPFLPQCQRPSFTPIQNNRQNYSSIYQFCEFTIYLISLELRERIICIGYMFLTNKRYCDQIPKNIIFQRQIHIRNVSAPMTKSKYRVAQNSRYTRCLTRCF